MNKVKLFLSVLAISLSSFSSTIFADDVVEGSLAFTSEECINVRSESYIESDVVALLHSGDCATILDVTDDGWYHISSGDITGYVSSEYMITGEYALEIAQDVGYQVAVVHSDSLNVRIEPNEDSDIIDVVYYGDELELLSYDGCWASVIVGGEYGYINGEHFYIETYYGTATPINETEYQNYDTSSDCGDVFYCEDNSELYVVDEYYESEDVVYEEYCYTEEIAIADSVYCEDSYNYEYDYSYVEEPQYDATQYDNTYSSNGQYIVDYALQFVGNPYVYGGTSLTNGTDCSGFTQSVYNAYGIDINRVASDQANGGTSVGLDDIQSGDLLFYSDGGGISHVGIYMGNGMIVHAANESDGIIVSDAYYDTPVSAVRYW